MLIVAAVASNYFDGKRLSCAAVPLYVALLFSLIGLLLTIKAAPITLGLAVPGLSPDAIRLVFDEFFVWDLYLRGSADTLAFAALILALPNLHRRD